MVFFGGPRQVGKTTLAKQLCTEHFNGGIYFNWDKDSDRQDILHQLIEVKTADSEVSSALRYYTERLKPKRAIQIVAQLKRPFHKDNILVTNPIDFFTSSIPWR
ncbi:MAG: AAA family ATPase [Verrucomicrobiota bacterium]|nr:AAA family ATPase [Verrucomicrobiota bacterium]